MKHDFKAAVEEMVDGRAGVGDWFVKHHETIRAALLLADKVTGEPSEGMVAAGNSASDWHLRDSDDVFKAMIEQAQKEVEQ